MKNNNRIIKFFQVLFSIGYFIGILFLIGGSVVYYSEISFWR